MLEFFHHPSLIGSQSVVDWLLKLLMLCLSKEGSSYDVCLSIFPVPPVRLHSKGEGARLSLRPLHGNFLPHQSVNLSNNKGLGCPIEWPQDLHHARLDCVQGKLVDGTVFDSSVERGEPITFTLGEVGCQRQLFHRTFTWSAFRVHLQYLQSFTDIQ